MDLAYGLFMAEAENRFPDERKRSIEHVIDDLVDCYNAGNSVDQSFKMILKKNNLTNASPREIEYISEQFSREIG